MEAPIPSEGDESRIALLSPELADQIAAGEVVERPASVIKELVENAVDAGATRIKVELDKAGLERIVVVDDGRGIHPDDLMLSITRHATSKVRRASDLIEVATMGFRGEALASIRAVADLTIESRTAEARTGMRLRSRPGLEPELSPVGMGRGTRIEVRALFGNVPARRKFMRSEATEVSHCSDTLLRLAVAHPHVHLRLEHGGRELLDLVPADVPERIARIVERRTEAALRPLRGVEQGVEVTAFLGPASAATRTRGGLFVVVRRRVVRERTLSQIVAASYGDALPPGRHPVGAVIVDPPPGSVDVNVHPQKAEVRFSDPQRVYAAVRTVLASFDPGHAAASETIAVRTFTAGAARGLQDWRPAPVAPPVVAGGSGGGPYRLRTRATAEDYASHRAEIRREVERVARPQPPAPPSTDPASPGAATSAGEAEGTASVTLLTCLPGPVAVLRVEDEIVAVDVLALRRHLVYRRLQQDLGGHGRVMAQGLLSPVVVRCAPAEVALCLESASSLGELGVVLEAFGEDAVMVRAVPAGLRNCVDEPDVEDLVARILPWLRLRAASGSDPHAGLQALAQTRGADPAPRLARRWIRELLEAGEDLGAVPGVVRWSAAELVR